MARLLSKKAGVIGIEVFVLLTEAEVDESAKGQSKIGCNSLMLSSESPAGLVSEARAKKPAWLLAKKVGVAGVSDFLSLKEADVAEFAKMLSKVGGKSLMLRWSEFRSVRYSVCVVGGGVVSSTGGGSVFTTNPNSLRDPYQYGPSPSLGAHPSVGVPDTTTELKVLPSFSSKSALSL